MRYLASVLLTVLLTNATARAQDFGTFDPLMPEEVSVEGSISVIDDPTGSAPTKKVFSFDIPEGACSDRPYVKGLPENDCYFNSTRSQYWENVKATKAYGTAQPKESWYTWAVYFPEDFPFGKRQIQGSDEFFFWHNGQCPHVTFMNWTGRQETLNFNTNRALGNYECSPALSLPLMEFKDLLGKWNRFEVFVKWATDDSGEVRVYVDGRYLLRYQGATLVPEYKDLVYFKFGTYLCCTPDVKTAKAQRLLYSAIRRGDERGDLFVEQDRARIKTLQERLNDLGCDVGAPDGVIGRRTRAMAVSCRAFEDGAMPSSLSAGSLETFVVLYSREGVADLPAGRAPDEAEDKPVVDYPGEAAVFEGAIATEYAVSAYEASAMKVGDDTEANSLFQAKVDNHPELSEFSFNILGTFAAAKGDYSELQFFLDEDAPEALAECSSSSTLVFPDGSKHVQVNFRKADVNFISTNAECLLEKLDGQQRAVVDFLTSHFSDVAVGMATQGNLERVSHNGIRVLLTKVAQGEITVGRETEANEGETIGGLLDPEFVVHAYEDRSKTTATAPGIGSRIVGSVEGKDFGDLDLHFSGTYVAAKGLALGLTIDMGDTLGDDGATALAGECRGASVFRDENGPHLRVALKVDGTAYTMPNGKCVAEALGGPIGEKAAFLLHNFSDIAVGMAAEGNLDTIVNDGFRDFMTRVSTGEVTVTD